MAGWSVDPVSLRISNARKTIKLEPRAMAVLDYLACRQGEVVSRQDLEAELWAGTVVGYDALGNAINKLRKAFGDKPRKPHIIETISKSGYRLIAEVSFEDGITLPDAPAVEEKSAPNKRLSLVAGAAAVVLILAMGIAIWWNPQIPDIEPASLEKMAFPLPDKPSIAVLPFINMSADSGQEYFADGMTEDLITDISKVPGLFVIARNSVFIYKNKPVKIQRVAEELGVRYVIEGSVRRVGNQVRINAQLIDVTTGGHLWAERYDGSLDDVFTMQDKISQKIVAALSVTLAGQGQVSRFTAETTNSEAYDAFLRGWEHYRQTTPDDYSRAISYFEQAVELDPEYSRAHTALAAVYWNSAWRRWSRTSELSYSQINEQARRYLKKAMQSPSALTHQVASEMAAKSRRKPDEALWQAELAIALDINDPAGHLAMANALLKADKPHEAIVSMHRAMRLDPHFPAAYLTRLGRGQFSLGQYQQAAITLEQSTARNPQDNRAYVFLAAAYARLGRFEEAKTIVSRVNMLRAETGWGEITLETVKGWKWMGDRKRLLETLALVGVKTGREWYALVTRTGDEFDVEGAVKINIEIAKQLYERGVAFVDPTRLYYGEHIQGAHHLSWSPQGKRSREDEFNKVRLMEIAGDNQEVVIYAADTIAMAAYASAVAVESGFPKVYYFENGLKKWKAAGYPVKYKN
jgi:adenylate cyclase